MLAELLRPNKTKYRTSKREVSGGKTKSYKCFPSQKFTISWYPECLGKLSCSPMFLLYFGARVYHHRQEDFAPEIWDKKMSLLRIFLLQSNGRDDTLIWSLTFKTNQRSFDVFEFQVDTINPVWSSFTWPWPAHKHQGNLASSRVNP